MKNPIIELQDVWKIYQIGSVEIPALRGMNFQVKEGEFVAVIGPSGSGKSTSMNLIGCLDIPTRGKIYLDGKDISQLDESSLAQIRGKKIGFIFQQFNLMGTLTALENVMLPMVFQGLNKEQRIKKAKDLLKLVELEDRMNHKPSELSGGQQQRVAIARALANDPEVILADEPTGNLDTKTGGVILEFLEKLNKEGKTVIIVTHDLNVAKRSKRVARLVDGKVIQTLKDGELK